MDYGSHIVFLPVWMVAIMGLLCFSVESSVLGTGLLVVKNVLLDSEKVVFLASTGGLKDSFNCQLNKGEHHVE